MTHDSTLLRFGVVAILIALAATGCMHPNLRTLEEFRAAKKAGDYALANTYLADNARIWFGSREGPGSPYTAKGGPYKEWDKVFRSSSTRKKPRATRRQVSYISQESNDYYRLLERTMGPARITWFFNDDGKITGMLYEGLGGDAPRPPDRECEFERWVEERYPGLLESADMEIPKNPTRWRELLIEWRADVDLPAVVE